MGTISEASILEFMREKTKPVTASELATALNVSRTDVNSILYRMEKVQLMKTSTVPPYWAMLPLEEQVINCLSGSPITAMEIAEQLQVPKTVVNSILYRLEGVTTYHDDEPRPNWYLKNNAD